MSQFRSGDGPTVQIGFTNGNDQKCRGHRGLPGNLTGALAYKIECLLCGHVYGANGPDVHERLCPNCQDGADGIDY